MIGRVVARTAIALGISIIIAVAVSGLVGAKTVSIIEGSLYPDGRPGIAVTIFAFSSSGEARIEVAGVSSLYYMKLRGDPMIVLRQLRTVNISLEHQNIGNDIRAGIAYGSAVLDANPLILGVLPAVSSIIPVGESKIGNGTLVVEEYIEGGEGVLVIGVGPQDTVKYTITYRVSGYEPTPPEVAITAGLILALSGILYLRLLRG